VTDLPYAVGCPSCDFYVEVSEADPDASLSELSRHIRRFHVRGSQGADWANKLLAKARELTEEEVAAR